jgi:hypothetical protein
MFEVVTGSRGPLCNGTSRRDFLRAGLFAPTGIPASAVLDRATNGTPIRELFS